MGMSPSQPIVHTFPPPPAQLANITPLPRREDNKMDIAQHLTERVESWFGTWSRCMPGKQLYVVSLSVIHSRVVGTVSRQGGLGIKVSCMGVVLIKIKGSSPQDCNGGLCRVPIPGVLTSVPSVPLLLPLPLLRRSILINSCTAQHSKGSGTYLHVPYCHALILTILMQGMQAWWRGWYSHIFLRVSRRFTMTILDRFTTPPRYDGPC